jgi:hypothetical protein
MNPATLAGGLEIFGPIHLLRLLQDSRVTGRLELVRGDEHVNLFVRRGRSVACTSSGARLRVGELLVRQGKVRPEVIDLALAVQTDEPGERIGRILVESGSVTESQVSNAVLTLQRQILYDVLLWREGSFRFHVGEVAPEAELQIDLNVDNLLVDLLRFAGAALKFREEREAA